MVSSHDWTLAGGAKDANTEGDVAVLRIELSRRCRIIAITSSSLTLTGLLVWAATNGSRNAIAHKDAEKSRDQGDMLGRGKNAHHRGVEYCAL